MGFQMNRTNQKFLDLESALEAEELVLVVHSYR
jgi:hypothetical protein